MRRLALWAAGRGPDPSFAAMVFWCCDRVLSPQLCRTKASCKRTRACWQLAVQKGRQSQGLELVSGQFRMRRLALWAASRGPDPSFAAMVFWCCDRFLSPQLCKTKASCKRTRARWQLAVQKGRQSQGLELVSRQFRKRRLALWAAGRGPIRPSLPWCFGAATGSSHRSCAGRKPAARGHKHAGSWQCRKAGKVKVWSWFLGSSECDVWHYGLPAAGQIRPSLPWCFGAATLGWADVLVST